MRRAGQASGRHQPQEHALRHQAPDRPPLPGKGSAEGHRPDALQDPQGRQRRRLGGSARREEGAAPDFRRSAAQDEEDRRGLSGRRGHRGGHHRAGLLQRFPAPGHQGCRPHRRSGSQAHHQRAHRRGPGLRHGQAGRRPQDRGVRPGRRHLRHLHHRNRRDRRRAPVRGAVHQRRHLPGRRGLRPAPHRLHHRRVQEGAGRRPEEGRAGPATPEGSRREGQDRAVLQPADRDQPALHHGGRLRSQAPGHEDHPGQVRVPGGRPDQAHHRALPHRHQGRRREDVRHRRRDPGGRHDPHAQGAGAGEGVLRQGAAQGRQPG